MTRRFRLLADEHIAKDAMHAVAQGGWTMQRVHQVLAHGTKDPEVFAYAAEQKLVWVTSDERAQVHAHRYLREGRSFAGMLIWRDKDRRRMTPGEFVRQLEEIEAEPDPFVAGVRFIHYR